jgi:predicted metal-dependent hydrolase
MSSNEREVREMAEVLEQQVLMYKQNNLLYQMKALINQKIKALCESLNYSSLPEHRKQEIEKQMRQLSDSLHKIESTINGGSSPLISQYITPQPRRD